MSGSLTLHHWQQLAKPHLATILDPHPGVVTKGFCPLAQDAIYRLSDMEEDEEYEEHRGITALEKGVSEQGKEEEDDEDDGITFKVRVSSTPEDRKDRKHSVSPVLVLPLSSTPPTLPGTPAASSSVTSTLCLTPTPRHVTEKSSLSSQPIPGISTAAVQSQSQICTSASTTASSSGKYFTLLFMSSHNDFFLSLPKPDLLCFQSKIQGSVSAPPSPPTPSQPVASCTPVTSLRSPQGKTSSEDKDSFYVSRYVERRFTLKVHLESAS